MICKGYPSKVLAKQKEAQGKITFCQSPQKLETFAGSKTEPDTTRINLSNHIYIFSNKNQHKNYLKAAHSVHMTNHSDLT